MNKNSTSTGVIILGGLAFLLIIFSFFAPYLFTGESSYDRYNFTQTGPIGDTIGGLMNPFIAIAGVIMTFLAFLMQVRANEIQRKQFLETLQKEEEREKTDSFYNLQILKLDIENIIDNIKTNIKFIDKFLTTTKNDPYKTCILFQTPLQQYERIKQIPRKLVFRGFDLYVNPIDKEWTRKFNNLYNITEYIPECLKNLYSIVEHHNNDVFKIKSKQRDELIKLESECCTILNNSQGTIDDRFRTAVKKILTNYKKDLQESKHENREGNFRLFKEILEDFNNNMEPLYPVDGTQSVERELLAHTHIITVEINYIEQMANQIITEVEKIKQKLNEQINSDQTNLTAIRDLIDSAIKKSELHISK